MSHRVMSRDFHLSHQTNPSHAGQALLSVATQTESGSTLSVMTTMPLENAVAMSHCTLAQITKTLGPVVMEAE